VTNWSTFPFVVIVITTTPLSSGCRSFDRMVVRFTTTYAISTYHHYNYQFKAIQHYVIKFVSDLLQVGGFLWVVRFPSPIKLTTTI